MVYCDHPRYLDYDDPFYRRVFLTTIPMISIRFCYCISIPCYELGYFSECGTFNSKFVY